MAERRGTANGEIGTNAIANGRGTTARSFSNHLLLSRRNRDGDCTMTAAAGSVVEIGLTNGETHAFHATWLRENSPDEDNTDPDRKSVV